MRRAAAAAIVALGASACGPDAPGVDATVQAVLSAPSGVQCIRIVASSATRTEVRQFAVAQGQASQPLGVWAITKPPSFVWRSCSCRLASGLGRCSSTWLE